MPDDVGESVEYKIRTSSFPHAALNPDEVSPRISLALAAELLDAIARARTLDLVPSIREEPAICIAVFSGGLVRWLVNVDEAEATLENFKQVLKAKVHHDA